MSYKFEDFISQRDNSKYKNTIFDFFGETEITKRFLEVFKDADFGDAVLQAGNAVDGDGNIKKYEDVDTVAMMDEIFLYFDRHFELSLHEMFSLTLFVGSNIQEIFKEILKNNFLKNHPELNDSINELKNLLKNKLKDGEDSETGEITDLSDLQESLKTLKEMMGEKSGNSRKRGLRESNVPDNYYDELTDYINNNNIEFSKDEDE